MQYGFSVPHVGQMRRAFRALAIAANCAVVAWRFGLAWSSR